MKSKYRVGIIGTFVLALISVAVVSISDSQTIQNIAFGFFFATALTPFFVRCESCGWSLYRHVTDEKVTMLDKIVLVKPLFGRKCMECGMQRH